MLKTASGSKNGGSALFGGSTPSRSSCLLKPDQVLTTRLLREEADDRYRYLVRHGNLLYVEADTLTIYVELAQIPNVTIIYRRPSERTSNPEKLALESRALKHVPLLEGEEKLKQLNLSQNEITKIENIVSLPNLTFLDLSQNKIAEISLIPVCQNLRVLILSKNFIDTIENLEAMPNLDVLDLNDNRILKLENLKGLTNLRTLNLANNLITVLDMPYTLKNLQELNLRKNFISEVREMAT